MLIRFEIESKLKMFIECRNLRTIFLEKLKHVGLYETEKSDIYSVKQVQKIQNNFCCSGFFYFRVRDSKDKSNSPVDCWRLGRDPAEQ